MFLQAKGAVNIVARWLAAGFTQPGSVLSGMIAGLSRRFGMVHVDNDTRQRTINETAGRYANATIVTTACRATPARRAAPNTAAGRVRDIETSTQPPSGMYSTAPVTTPGE